MGSPVMGITVSRTLLGLSALDINDHTNYITSATFLGSGVTYRRSQVRSPYVDGAITTNRVKDIVQDQIAIDIPAPDQALFQYRIGVLQDAFAQDEFVLTLTLDGTPWAWLCEASDYKMDWSVPRIHGLFGQVQYTLIRQPVAVQGPDI